MRIFIDVGAHYGETLSVALDPKWGFERVFCIEPSALCQPMLRGFRDKRVVVQPFALSNRNGDAVLHGAGLLGGSLYADKTQIAKAVEKVRDETIPLVSASEWFARNIPSDALVYLKMNCEGGEADILEDLLDSGLIKRVASMYIDFDIRKVPSQAHRQAGIERRLGEAGISYTQVDRAHVGANWGVEAWLEKDCSPIAAPLFARISHRLYAYAPPYAQATKLLGMALPKPVFWWIGRRFGRVARAS